MAPWSLAPRTKWEMFNFKVGSHRTHSKCHWIFLKVDPSQKQPPRVKTKYPPANLRGSMLFCCMLRLWIAKNGPVGLRVSLSPKSRHSLHKQVRPTKEWCASVQNALHLASQVRRILGKQTGDDVWAMGGRFGWLPTSIHPEVLNLDSWQFNYTHCGLLAWVSLQLSVEHQYWAYSPARDCFRMLSWSSHLHGRWNCLYGPTDIDFID